MQRFGVGQHAVEIENDGFDHVSVRGFKVADKVAAQCTAGSMRSPARIGTGNRFSRGGYGQSNAGL